MSFNKVHSCSVSGATVRKNMYNCCSIIATIKYEIQSNEESLNPVTLIVFFSLSISGEKGKG